MKVKKLIKFDVDIQHYLLYRPESFVKFCLKYFISITTAKFFNKPKLWNGGFYKFYMTIVSSVHNISFLKNN